MRNEDDGSGSEGETRDPIPKCPASGSSVNQMHESAQACWPRRLLTEVPQRGALFIFLTSEETNT